MIMKNGLVFQEDGTFCQKDLYVENGKFVATEAEVTDKTEFDASGLKIIPGLVDVHSHGAFGHDFCDADPEGLKVTLKYEKEHGITSYCPTSMTLDKERLLDIFATAGKVEESPELARIIGINMEGPLIDIKKKGAQAGDYIRVPDASFFRKCNNEVLQGKSKSYYHILLSLLHHPFLTLPLALVHLVIQLFLNCQLDV
ncbi:MAG: hypothetical protein UCV58_03430 [Clostridium saudiense]|nr:hypothetical protein [Clostridium saudiense]